MKKYSIIAWVLIGIILLFAILFVLVPIFTSATIVLKVFGIFFNALGMALQFVIVAFIVFAILFYIFKRNS